MLFHNKSEEEVKSVDEGQLPRIAEEKDSPTGNKVFEPVEKSSQAAAVQFYAATCEVKQTTSATSTISTSTSTISAPTKATPSSATKQPPPSDSDNASKIFLKCTNESIKRKTKNEGKVEAASKGKSVKDKKP